MSLTIIKKFTCDSHPEACGEELKKTKSAVEVKGVGLFCKKCYKKIKPQPVEEEEEESESESESEDDAPEPAKSGGITSEGRIAGEGWETQEARRERRNADFQKSFTEFQEKHFQLQLGDDED